MRKGERKTSRCLSFCKQNLNSRDSWEEDWAPSGLPLKSVIIWKSSHLFTHIDVYLCLSHYISFCTYYCLHLYITVIIQLHFKVFCTHFLQTGKPYKQTQEIGRYFIQSVYSSDPQRFSNNTKKICKHFIISYQQKSYKLGRKKNNNCEDKTLWILRMDSFILPS